MAKLKIFRRISDNKGDDAIKLAPQEVVVFNAIPKVKAGIERAALIAKLVEMSTTPDPANAGKFLLNTGQAPSSILGYYTKHLVDSKLISIEVIEEAKPEPTAEKPVKAA